MAATDSASPAILRRSRLDDRLDAAFSRRLTVVVAEAGFGKSTLLSTWARAREPHVGMASAAKRGPLQVMAALRDALQQVHVAVPAAPVEREQRKESPMAAAAMASWLSQEVAARLSRDVVVILDDCHELSGRWSAAFLEALVLQAPERMHLVLSSRVEPAFPVQRLRGRGEVAEIRASDLAFDLPETAAFVDATLGDAAPNLAASLQHATAGWPVAIRLGVEAMRDADQAARAVLVHRLSRPGGPLFAYLAEEVFARQPEWLLTFVRTVAPLDGFTVELAEAVGAPRAREAVEALERRGLIVRGEADELSLHALLRDFALEARVLPRRSGQVLRRAASWWLRAGDVERSLRLALGARDRGVIERILATRGNELVLDGHSELVLEAAAGLTASLSDAGLHQVVAEAHLIRGDWAAASTSLERAAGGDSGAVAPRLAWLMGRLEWDRGRFPEALAAYRRARLDGSDPANEALALAGMSQAHWNLGDADEAWSAAQRALGLASQAGEPRAMAAAHNAVAMAAPAMDSELRRIHFRDALAAAEQAGDVAQSIRLRVNLSTMTPSHDALDLIGSAIAGAELMGAPVFLAVALNNRGEHYAGLGRYDDAGADYRRATGLFQAAGSGRAGWSLMNLGDVARERGDLALARSQYREAVRTATHAGDAQGEIGGKAGLARLLAGEDPPRAADLAAEAVALARPLHLHLARALLAAGWVALQDGRVPDAAVAGREAEAAARDQGWPPDVAEALELQAMSTDAPDRRPLLEAARAAWSEHGSPVGVARVDLAVARSAGDRAGAAAATRMLRTAGVGPRAADAAGLLAALPPDEPPSIEIRTLGGFAVRVDGLPVPTKAWRSRKTRDLLKVLVARRGRSVPRDELGDLLWPEADPDEIANRLSVAASLLRRVFSRAGQEGRGSPLLADPGALALERSAIEIDVESFLVEAERGLVEHSAKPDEARAHLEVAEALYAGPFLEEDPYQDWAIGLREEARATYIAVTRRLAEFAAARGDHDLASRYLLRILDQDRFDERAHLDLVAAMARAGRHGEARRVYRGYVERMTEIGVQAVSYPA